MQPVQQHPPQPQATIWATRPVAPSGQALPAGGQTAPAPRRSASLKEAVRRCQSDAAAGLVVAAAEWPQMAASLLEDVANTTGALVWRPRQGGFWLLGTTAGAARETLGLFESMGWTARLLLFPGDIAVLDAALEEDGALPAIPAADPPGLIGIEDRARAMPAASGHALATIWRLEAGLPKLLAQRWMVEPGALPTPPGRDWAGHAQGLLASRLLQRAARQAWPAARKQRLPLLLDMPWMPPPSSLPAPPPGGGPGMGPGMGSEACGHALVLPLPAAAEAEAWAALAAAHGWQLAWAGLTPALAHLATPQRLPGRLFFTEYSPLVASTVWPAPECLVLQGGEGRAALDFAAKHDISLCSRMG